MTRIIQAGLANLDQVTTLFEAYRQFYQKPPALLAARDFIEQRLTQGDSVIFLALEADKAAGFVQLYPAFSSTAMQRMWYLNDLYIDTQFRRQQIGKQLMNAATKHAKATKAHSLKLCTAVGNHQAKALYQQLGYQQITAFDHYTLLLQ